MRMKKVLTLSFFMILICVMLILPKQLITTSGAVKTLAGLPRDSHASNETLSRRVQQEFSETALEYLVNKPTDPSINKTIIGPNPERSIDYAEKEPTAMVPDLNGTANLVLYTNSSVISFSSPC